MFDLRFHVLAASAALVAVTAAVALGAFLAKGISQADSGSNSTGGEHAGLMSSDWLGR